MDGQIAISAGSALIKALLDLATAHHRLTAYPTAPFIISISFPAMFAVRTGVAIQFAEAPGDDYCGELWRRILRIPIGHSMGSSVELISRFRTSNNSRLQLLVSDFNRAVIRLPIPAVPGHLEFPFNYKIIRPVWCGGGRPARSVCVINRRGACDTVVASRARSHSKTT